MPKPFIHLHLHTEYSLLDGAVQLDRLMQKLKEQGAPAVAMTDHGNMYATIKFYNACKKEGIKPIIGCEMYVTDDINKKDGRGGENKLNHLVLIAKNETGYKNLSKLNSISWIDGFYYKPRIDLNILKDHTEGLICLSACIAGKVQQLLLKNDYDGALEYAKNLRDMFEEGDFYIELQNHGLPEQKIVNPLLVKIAKELNVKCVATNDVHYINKSDAEMHDVLLCIQTGTYIDTPDRMKFPCDEFYLKNYQEMEEAIGWCPEALDTPYEIMDKCDVNFVFNKYQIPYYICPDNLTPEQYLTKMTYEGLVRRYGEVPEEYKKRAEYELEVINSMGFAGYYLIVWDYINYSKTHGIPVGAGRGSGVGSIVAYCIGITNVDPMKYDLIFERFLNKDRTSMPDFDVDFCFFRRGEVIQYVKEKYGEDHISQIITFGKMKKKQAIKDVARVFHLSFAEVSKLTKNIGKLADDKKVHIGDLLNPESKSAVPELIEQYNNNETYKKVLDLAMQIENMPRHTGIHAAGVVIYKNPAMDTIPLAKNGNEITSQFDMIEVEKLGLLKMDFLALMTLTDIKMAHGYVQKRTGIDLNFEKLGYSDPNVYNYLASGGTDAVFQLEGGGMKKFMMKMRPNSMEDIIAGISLYRPGPMDFIDEYLSNRSDPEHIHYDHPLLKPILAVTSGITVYQEQAMAITRALAGYDMTSADHFRAIISKKKEHEIPAEKDLFLHGRVDKDGNVIIPGCVRNGVPEEVGDFVFEKMKKFASYAFNKSHAAAYAVLSYETAYYKLYYPVEFLAAVINNRIGKSEETEKYMRVLTDLGIKLLQPDINESEVQFSPGDKAVRYGLSCIKNVGRGIMETAINERNQNGKYKDLYDFIDRMHGTGINKKTIESLIKGGAFDCFGQTRNTLLANYEQIVSTVDQQHKLSDSNQMNIFALLGDDKPAYKYIVMKELPLREKLLFEKEMLGMYVTGHPLAGYEAEFSAFNFNTSMLPKPQEESDEEVEEEDLNEDNSSLAVDGMDVNTGGILAEVSIKRTKDGKEMAVCTLEDMYDKVEIVIFSRALITCKKDLIKDTLVRINGRLSINDGESKITVNRLTPWALVEHDEKIESSTNDNRILYVNILFDDEDRYERLMNILKAHPGDRPARAQIKGKIYNLPYTVGNLDLLEKELHGIIGSENVKLVTPKQ